jgi:hypothetical protein
MFFTSLHSCTSQLHLNLEVHHAKTYLFCNCRRDNGVGYDGLGQSRHGNIQWRRCSAKGDIVVAHGKPVPADSGIGAGLLIGPSDGFRMEPQSRVGGTARTDAGAQDSVHICFACMRAGPRG